MPHIRHEKILAKDGLHLSATLFDGTDHTGPLSKQLIIINSAVGVAQIYYAAYAKYLANAGAVVVTYDYRGIAASMEGNIKQSCFTMLDWGEKDFYGVIQWSKKTYPDRTLKCVGHSVGAQLLGLTSNNAEITEMISVGGQVGYWKHWQGLNKLKIWFSVFLIIPLLVKLMGYLPGWLMGGCDLPAGIATQWASWCRNSNFIIDKQGNPIRENFDEYSGKILFLSFYDDTLMAPKPSVDALAHYFNNAKIEQRHIDAKMINGKKIGHFGFFRSKFRKTLWQASKDNLSGIRETEK